MLDVGARSAMTSRQATPHLAHRGDLDGLRGLAIALVLLEHTGLRGAGAAQMLPFSPAMAGVTAFFVLSGYLITGGLVLENPINLRHFYLRRVVRLAPAFSVLLACTAVVGVLGLWSHPWLPGMAVSLAYVSNFAQIAGVDLGLLGHTWTLAIEEQFYVIWPLAMLVVPRRRLVPVAVGGAALGCFLYATGSTPGSYHSTITNGGALLAGCAVALLDVRLPRLFGLFGVALIWSGAIFWSQAAATVGAVLVVSSPIAALTPLAGLGRRAYSLYLWSWPLTMILGGAVALPVTLGIAEGSFRLIERPVLERFRRRTMPRPVVSANGALGTQPV